MTTRPARLPDGFMRMVIVLVAVVLGAILAFNIIRALRGLIVLLLISLFLSIALEPAVNWLAQRGWRRGAATGVIFGTFVVLAITFLALMVPLVIDQTFRFVENAPGYVDSIAAWAEDLGIGFEGVRLREAFSDLDDRLQERAGDIIGSMFGVGTRLLATIFQLLTIGLFTFYMTADGPRLRRAALSLLNPDRQRQVLALIDVAIEKTGGYFYSRSLLVLVSAVVGWVVFSVIGLPFALALALWMAVFSQFVPVVGTYIGGAFPALIGFLEGTTEGLIVIGYVVVYQQIENYVLAPRITARTMALHPAVSFGSAIAGGTILGVPGALMALPVAATLQAFVSTYLHRHEVIEDPLTELPPDEEDVAEGAEL